uniref:DUF1963 domain-containing protein n=2 Tax=Steinernema glaseri TaxID=37863 RepID=A0A1I7ZGD6_9BILA
MPILHVCASVYKKHWAYSPLHLQLIWSSDRSAHMEKQHCSQMQEASALLKESLDRLNAIRYRVYQKNSRNPQEPSPLYFEEFVQLVDNAELMTVAADRSIAYFFSSADSWIFFEKDADSGAQSMFFVHENPDGAPSIQKIVY